MCREREREGNLDSICFDDDYCHYKPFHSDLLDSCPSTTGYTRTLPFDAAAGYCSDDAELQVEQSWHEVEARLHICCGQEVTWAVTKGNVHKAVELQDLHCHQSQYQPQKQEWRVVRLQKTQRNSLDAGAAARLQCDYCRRHCDSNLACWLVPEKKMVNLIGDSSVLKRTCLDFIPCVCVRVITYTYIGMKLLLLSLLLLLLLLLIGRRPSRVHLIGRWRRQDIA